MWNPECSSSLTSKYPSLGLNSRLLFYRFRLNRLSYPVPLLKRWCCVSCFIVNMDCKGANSVLKANWSTIKSVVKEEIDSSFNNCSTINVPLFLSHL
jgi:hypothetical protein